MTEPIPTNEISLQGVNWAAPIAEPNPLIRNGSTKNVFTCNQAGIGQRLLDDAFTVSDSTPAVIHLSDLGFTYLTDRTIEELGGINNKFFLMWLGQVHSIPMGTLLNSRGVNVAYFVNDDFHERELQGFKSEAGRYQTASRSPRINSIAQSFDVHTIQSPTVSDLPSIEMLKKLNITEVIILEEASYGLDEERTKRIGESQEKASDPLLKLLKDIDTDPKMIDSIDKGSIISTVLKEYHDNGINVAVFGVDPRINGSSAMKPLIESSGSKWEEFVLRPAEEKQRIMMDLLMKYYTTAVTK